MDNHHKWLPQEQAEQLSLFIEENKEALRLLGLSLEHSVLVYEQQVNKVNVTDSSSERDLLYKRLKADGARKLLLDFRKLTKI